jgi:hypothetical protein
MDGSTPTETQTHPERKGNVKDEKKRQGRDDLKHGSDKGRYEGGRDADQPRQAHGRKERDEDKPATSEPLAGSSGKSRRGMEEE